MSYKVEAVAQLAQQIKASGFRVFLSKSGTYGFYTDAEGTKVVSFQLDLGGFNFTGNYTTDQPRMTGAGWQLAQNRLAFAEMFNESPPAWAIRDANWKYTTLAKKLEIYQKSSGFYEI